MILNQIVRNLHGTMFKECLGCSKKLFLAQNATSKRHYTSSNFMKVTVIGAAGNIGQSLSLMLKQSPMLNELCLYDLKPTMAFAADLNFIDTKCRVTSYTSKDISSALAGSTVVVLCASAPHVDRLQESVIFDMNAPIIREVALHIAKHCPKTFIAIVTEPVEYLVPYTSEILKKHGSYNPNTIIGVTSIDVVRANTFVAEVLGLEPECVFVPILGGHVENTIVPILSQAVPCSEFTNEELEDITKSVKEARDNILKIKSSGTYTLSGAFSVARCIISVIKAMRGGTNIVECVYVKSTLHPQLRYMVSPVMFGPAGVAKNLGIPDMTDYETCQFENMIPILAEKIKIAEECGGRQDKSVCDPCDPNPRAPPCPPDHCAIQSMRTGNK